jgi:hypothetical protein
MTGANTALDSIDASPVPSASEPSLARWIRPDRVFVVLTATAVLLVEWHLTGTPLFSRL